MFTNEQGTEFDGILHIYHQHIHERIQPFIDAVPYGPSPYIYTCLHTILSHFYPKDVVSNINIDAIFTYHFSQ